MAPSSCRGAWTPIRCREGRLPFLGIAAVVEETLSAVEAAPVRGVDDLRAADAAARRLAERELAPA